MSAYDQFLSETKSQQPTGTPKVVPVSVGNSKQPDTAPVVTSAYERFQQETAVSPVVTPKASVVTPQVEKPSVVSTIGSGLGKVLDWFGKNQKQADEANYKLKTLMTQGKDSLASYENATPEEKAKILDQENQNVPLVKFLNSDTGKKITSFVARNSSNIPLKAYASIKALGDTTYDEAYNALLEKSKDPTNSMAEKIFYGVQDSGVQSLVGVLLGLSVSAITRGRVSPAVATTPFFSAISADSQQQEKGRVDSLGNIAIDTVGDSVLSGFAESALKGVLKEGGETTLKRILKESGKGFTVEGSTEVAQSFLKYANDYKNAPDEATKQKVVQDLASYVKEGGMAQEFLIGGIAGGIITGGASAIGGGKVDPNLVTKEEAPIDPKSAYATYLGEKGVDLSKPDIEIQKSIEKVNAPQGSVQAEGFAPLEGVKKDNTEKISYEQASPLADKAVTRYWSEKIQPEIDKGEPIVIGADDLKDHFSKDYNDNNHPIYSQSAFKLFELALQKTKGDTLVLTAGGAGSGKTELVTKSLIRSGFNGIIYDSNLANYDGAVKQIDLAREAGKKIEIRGVLPNLEKSRTFTIQREGSVGRGISDATFARGHAGMPAVLAKLIESGKVKESEVKLLDTRETKTLEEAMDKIIDDNYVTNVLDTVKNIGYNEDNLKTTYAKTNFDKTTGQRTNGQVPDSKGASVTPTQDRTDKGEANRGSNGSVLPKESKRGSKKEEVKPNKEKATKKENTESKIKKNSTKSSYASVGDFRETKSIQNYLREKYPEATFSISENGDEIVLHKIVAQKKGQGIGTKAMEDLISYADDRNKKVVLTPSKDFGASSVARLTSFYKRFGFVENKGKNKDFSTRESMIRLPVQKSSGGSSFASIGRYREEGNVVAGRIDEIKSIEFPELLDLAKELSGNIPFIKKYTKANGMFYGKGTGEIGLNPDLFKEGNLGQLQKTFAHEIGHLIDYLPDQTMKRGNVLARLSVLKGFTKDFYEGAGATRTDKEVRSQLWELSKYWKPVDEETAPKSYLDYRKSSPEVYADFISALFNDPNLVAVKAPTAYNVFFEQLDKKPLVKKAYFELQDFLRYGDRVAKRRSATNQMFKLTEQQSRERQIQMQQELEAKEKSVWFKFKTEMVDITEAVKEDVKRAQSEGKVINPDDNPTYYLEERNYLGGKIKSEVDTKFNNIYQDLQKEGMTWEDLGELMFYERILKGDRGEVANPLGYQPDFVQELMDTYQDVGTVKPDTEAHKKGTSDMKSTLGESKYLKLQELAVQYRENLKGFFEEGRKEGIYSEDLAKLFEDNAFYVPFKGAKYSGVSRTTFGVKQQKGTLGNIENPANTGIEKAVSIIRAIERNRVTRKTVEFYQENFPAEVTEATRDQQGYPLPAREQGQTLVTYMEDGKVKGYYVDSYVAEAIQKNTVGKMNQLVGALRFFNSGLFRPLFITFNLGFQSFNLIRDFKRFWKNVPNMTLFRAMKLYGQSARASKIRAFGLPENPSVADQEAYDLINKLENDKIISITYNDIIKGENIEDAQIDRILRETGVREAQQTKLGAIGEKLGLTKETPLIKQAFQVLDFIEKTGNLIETLPKVAGVLELEGKMKPIEMRSFVRKYVGSPDFLAGGRDKKSMNEIFLFANAIAQGVRSDYDIATQPKSRGAYWLKTAQSELLPKMLMLAVTAGLFGDWLKELFGKVSEYDKANYTIIPLGEDENGKAIYFRMPSDESGRLIGGLFWKIAQSVSDPKKLAELSTYTDLLTYAGGQVPSVSPVASLGLYTIPSFVAGQNPYDFFRGRPILTDEQQQAGGMERVKPFLSYMFNQMGGNVFTKLYTNEQMPKDLSLSEKIVNLPVLSNIAGRFVKVSNYGETEQLRQISNDVRTDQARESLANRRVVYDYVDQAQGKSYNEQQALKRQMVKDIIGDKVITKEDRQKKASLEKRFTTLIIRGSADPKVDMLVTAQSNDEKVALLTEYQKTMSKEKFEDLRRFIIKNKVVSSDAYRQFIVNSNKK